MTEFIHINQQGYIKVVDMSGKQVTKRTAVTHLSIAVSGTILKQISNNTNIKGNVLSTAQTAGTMVAKNILTLIPTCRSLPLTGIDVHSSWDGINAPFHTLNIRTTVSITGKIGVEVETLIIASAAALTIYDMTKVTDRGITIDKTYLKSRSGGKSGDFQRRLNQ